MEEINVNLWKLLEAIARRMKFIVLFVLVVSVLAAIISLILPRWYKATALILPPKEEGFKLGWSGASLDDMLSLTSGVKLPVMATPTDVYARILESRNLADRVIQSNNLTEYYHPKNSEDLYIRVAKYSDFRVTPEGLLEISYMDKNPEMAARVANSFADELDLMNREIASSRARIAKEFIENRLRVVKSDLDSSRLQLREFQDNYKAIDLDKQTQLAIESAVGLKVDLAQYEIDLKVKEHSLSPNHPEAISLRRRIEEIKNQIANLEFGGTDSSYLNLPISRVPTLKIRYAELTGRVQISERLYEILSEQYEQAKIQEKMDTPTISILDRAYPPQLAVKPKKRIIVIFALILSLLAAVFIALILDYLENLKKKSPEDYERAAFFFRTLLGWIPGIRKSLK
nr:hypothetical protein [candidate division Zixibacteria bacterium]